MIVDLEVVVEGFFFVCVMLKYGLFWIIVMFYVNIFYVLIVIFFIKCYISFGGSDDELDFL